MDWFKEATREEFYMYETIQYWWLKDENPYIDSEYIGLGYLKKVFRAKLTDDNMLLFDKYGHPMFRPDKELGILHQESGYFMAYKDKDYPDSDYKIVKTITVPRGVTVNVRGEYKDGVHKMEMRADERDSSYGVLVSPTADNSDKGYSFKLNNYE